MPATETGRDHAQLHDVARRRLRDLGLSPPLDTDALRTALEQDRGSSIALVPTDELPMGSAFGVTGSRPGIDVVLYERRTTPSQQQLIILHEFAHMLLRHPPSSVLHTATEPGAFREIDAATVAAVLGLRDDPGGEQRPDTGSHRRRRWRRRSGDTTAAPAAGSLYAGVEEREAEILATILLGWAPGQTGHVPSRPREALGEFLSAPGAW
ncbi:hypothetical protein Ae168Ps1_2890 [Pseudonocardia sp. Ae168_Ps1]|uniref:hypothetical protein n=1 Tax=unclassified Pseudonocardia TaxID=2619320 RepID=UPI00094B04B7|nr:MULTISPECIES: hypothetical protein [unclassified Pseudonocardia]OLL74504.1 hypothetical protein Ae150APs1_2882 [Pseudonocardia sp. Ae150A_Ps1]OLL80484.1 hypothetical protein Ae168Ps1_2890 [Pseudonocardia sp. Ae168_Ps1]OLL85389.1 hypothetical protein Ae263Ps1_2444c [Pseudonocardia sp. Ae263_Ps1]OLL94584.1 hypothetical protein Ae356Ps1_4481 [Pseudonocardia sp. Ae356_Ps1]